MPELQAIDTFAPTGSWDWGSNTRPFPYQRTIGGVAWFSWNIQAHIIIVTLASLPSRNTSPMAMLVTEVIHQPPAVCQMESLNSKHWSRWHRVCTERDISTNQIAPRSDQADPPRSWWKGSCRHSKDLKGNLHTPSRQDRATGNTKWRFVMGSNWESHAALAGGMFKHELLDWWLTCF